MRSFSIASTKMAPTQATISVRARHIPELNCAAAYRRQCSLRRCAPYLVRVQRFTQGLASFTSTAWCSADSGSDIMTSCPPPAPASPPVPTAAPSMHCLLAVRDVMALRAVGLARIELINDVKGGVSIPVIASSGAGNVDHFYEVFTKTKADAALAAGIFHRNEVPLQAVKAHLISKGIAVRK